jgi:hypothetical protein
MAQFGLCAWRFPLTPLNRRCRCSVSDFGNNVFALANPWGPNSTENGVSAGMILLTVNQMVNAGFDGWAEFNFSWHISAVQMTQMAKVSLGHAGGALAAPISTAIPGVDVHADILAREHAFVRTPSVATMASVIARDDVRAVGVETRATERSASFPGLRQAQAADRLFETSRSIRQARDSIQRMSVHPLR